LLSNKNPTFTYFLKIFMKIGKTNLIKKNDVERSKSGEI
jgi:hypothetical protein